VIHNLPVIAKMAAVGKACGNMFQLQQGNSAETSGGLLICLPRYITKWGLHSLIQSGSAVFFDNVANPGCLSRILIFVHLGYNNSDKRGGGGDLLSYLFC
jgi:hypothetical protein